MKNRKKERMDTIDRRLDWLEGCLAAQSDRIYALENPDDPRFSCDPRLEPDDDRVIRWQHPEMRGIVPDDVRERVRERSDLADSAAARGETARELLEAFETNLAAMERKANRYENSLRALMQMLLPAATVGAIRRPPDHADLFAMVEGCLAGGTITLDGLQQDD